MDKKKILLIGLALLLGSCGNLQLTEYSNKNSTKQEQQLDNQFVDAVIDVMNEKDYNPIKKNFVPEEVKHQEQNEDFSNEGIDVSDSIGQEKNVQPEKIVSSRQSDDESIFAEKVLKNSSEQDIINKVEGKDKLVYLKDNLQQPFTGTFVSFIGLHRVYSEEYIDGKLNGNKIWYGDNDEVGLIEPYKDNKVDGVQKTYHLKTGKIRSEISYKAGKVDGNIIWYNENGQVMDEQKIINGTGTWVSYWSNGQLREKGNYKNFKRDGKWIRYTKNGILEKEQIYKNGRLVTREWLE
ncbi:toxin-antitoxin system YwqK family antitoxin [Cetobacterium sp. SF1]|uniref:toxin-antitoxin system YwqK family antitoxin n=1 Tax=unclassified Cetobacterium TaxID=2630983 RepID=UPI003CF817C4